MIRIPRFLAPSFVTILLGLLVAWACSAIWNRVSPQKPKPLTPEQTLEGFYKLYDPRFPQRHSEYLAGDVSPQGVSALSVFDANGYCGYNKSGYRICADEMQIVAISILLENLDDTAAIALVDAVLRPYRFKTVFPHEEFPSRVFSHKVNLRHEEDKWLIVEVTDVTSERESATYDVKYVVSGNTVTKAQMSSSYVEPQGILPTEEIGVPWETTFTVSWGQRLFFGATLKYGSEVTCEIIVNGKSIAKVSATNNGWRADCEGYAVGEFGSPAIPLDK